MSHVDPHDPRYKELAGFVHRPGGGVKQFGRFTGLPGHIPTLTELGVTAYLDRLKVPYELHRKVATVVPDYPGGNRAEYDIFLPKYGIAIESSPGWHEGGSSEIPRVAQNDRLKREYSEKAGIMVLSFDPGDDANEFARNFNSKVVPILREHGINAPVLNIYNYEKKRRQPKRLSR